MEERQQELAGDEAGVVIIPLREIHPDPEQPRKFFDPEALEELRRSIEVNGLRNPIHVKPDSATGGFLIVAGERRWRCMRELGAAGIRAFVMPADTDALVFGLVDNLNRENLNPMEEAWGYAKLIERGLTQADVARRMGRSQGHVSNILLLTQLPEEVQEAVAEKKFPTAGGMLLVRQCRGQEDMSAAFQEFRERQHRTVARMTAGALMNFLKTRNRRRQFAEKGTDAAVVVQLELQENITPAAARLAGILDELVGDDTEEGRRRFHTVWKSLGPRGSGDLLTLLRAINDSTKKLTLLLKREVETS